MPFDEDLAKRVRDTLTNRVRVEEKRMFGGIAFMVRGHMCCGVLRDDLVVRVGPGAYEQALQKKGARPMDFTGRALRGMVYVDKSHLSRQRDLERWADDALGFVTALPKKTAKQSTGESSKVVPKRTAKQSAGKSPKVIPKKKPSRIPEKPRTTAKQSGGKLRSKTARKKAVSKKTARKNRV